MPQQGDPITGSSIHLFGEMVTDMKNAIDGLPPVALNWKPGGEDTNSIAVLAFHSLKSTRQWLCVAVDVPLPERDRDAEFEASFDDPASLIAFVDEMSAECRNLLKNGQGTDWGAMRHHWDDSQNREFPAAWALIHALEHLREHIGHIGLTRQIWTARDA